MKYFLIKWIGMTLAVLVTSYVLPGIVVTGLLTAAVVALVLGLVNVFVRPLLILLTLPLTIMTLGLFLLVLNALLLYLVAALVDGFFIVGFGWALLGAVFISLVSWMINSMIRSRDK